MAERDTILHGITYPIGRSGFKRPPENVHVDEDYPYGRTLRCRRAHWVERATTGAQKGKYRHVTCTTNPKSGDRWNAPKPGGYSAVLVLYTRGDHAGAEAGCVAASGLELSASLPSIEAFEARWAGQLPDSIQDDLRVLRTIAEKAERTYVSSVTTSKHDFDGNGLREVEAPKTDHFEPPKRREDTELWTYAAAGADDRCIDAKHIEAFGQAVGAANRMAEASGLTVVMSYHPYWDSTPFRFGPLTIARLRNIMGDPDRKPDPIVYITGPAPIIPPDSGPDEAPADTEPTPDTDPTPAPIQAPESRELVKVVYNPTETTMTHTALIVVDDPQDTGIDWEDTVKALDATESFERDGRTVKMLELCDEIQAEDVPADVFNRSCDEAQARGLAIVVEGGYGYYLLRDMGPIPPDADDEPEPTDRADDDGMAHPDVPVPWTVPRFNIGDRVEFITELGWTEGTITDHTSDPDILRRYSIAYLAGLHHYGVPALHVRAAASDPIDRAPQPSPVARPWLGPVPRPPLALPAPHAASGRALPMPASLAAFLDACAPPQPVPVKNWRLTGGRTGYHQGTMFGGRGR